MDNATLISADTGTRADEKFTPEPPEEHLVNIASDSGRTPLHEALRCGSIRCAEVILSLSQFLSPSKQNGWTDIRGNNLLHSACYEDNDAVLELIVSPMYFKRFRLWEQARQANDEGFTPLDVARASHDESKVCLELLNKALYMVRIACLGFGVGCCIS